MAYYFFLSALPIPITPGALSIKTPSQNKTINLINEGEINIIKEQGLREISFDFLLPQQHYPFINGAKAIENLAFTNGLDLGFIKIGRPTAGNYLASIYIPILNELKKRKKPVQFIVARMSPDNKPLFYTNIKCAIEEFSYEEDAEAHGLDVMCSITLKEYKVYGTKSFSLSFADEKTKKVVATVKKAREAKAPPKTYTTKTGDTPAVIAQKTTGSTNDAKLVMSAAKLPVMKSAPPPKLKQGYSKWQEILMTIGRCLSGGTTPSGIKFSVNPDGVKYKVVDIEEKAFKEYEAGSGSGGGGGGGR